jgi:hypothetical protein
MSQLRGIGAWIGETIAGLESHHWFEPAEQITPELLFWFWIVPFAAIILSSVVARRVFGRMDEYDPFSEYDTNTVLIGTVVVAPLLEEAVFRIVPALFGASFTLMFLLSVIWVLTHGRRMVGIALFMPFYLKLALGGFLIELVVFHTIHNIVATSFYIYRDDDREFPI